MPTNRVYRIAVIPGDGIGKEVVPEGMRVLEVAAKKFGFELRRRFRFRLLRLLRKASAHDAGRLEGENRPPRRDLLRRGRLAGQNPRSYFAVGLAYPVPPRVRPIRQSAPGAADARRAVAAGQPQARRYRFLGGAGKYRRRIFGDRRPHVRRHRARSRGAGNRDVADRRRPGAEIRLRTGAEDAEKASDFGHQIERHRHHHAVLGRAGRGDGEELSRREVGQIPHRYSLGAVRAQARPLQRRRGVEPVRRHSVRPRSGLYRHHRHRAVGQYQSGAQISRPCSSRCTARRRISPGKTSPIRSARSGRGR